MDIITAIATATSSLKTATEVARGIVDSSGTLERAELNLRLAEIILAVANARSQLSTIQEAAAEHQEEIARLREAFEQRGSVVRWQDAYYFVNPEGKPANAAHCAKCWDDSQLLRRLVSHPNDHRLRLCQTCGSSYDSFAAQDLRPEGPE